MLNNLPDELIILIFKNLYNYDIFNLNQVSINFNKIINNNSFIEYIQTRSHPIFFDSWDTYCHICNIHIYKISQDLMNNCIWCKH